MVAGAGAVVLAVLSGVLAGGPGASSPQQPAGPPAPAGTVVLVLARDLHAGVVPGPGDLRRVRVPAAAVPSDAVAPADRPDGGGPLALAGRRGDVLTRRQLGDGWAPAGGLRSYALPLGEGVEAGPLVPGDRVDVVTAGTGGAATVLRDAPVLRLVPGPEGRPAQVVLGVGRTGAEALAAARAAGPLTLVQAPPPG